MNKEEIIERLYKSLQRPPYFGEENSKDKLNIQIINENGNIQKIDIEFETFKQYILNQKKGKFILNNNFQMNNSIEFLVINEAEKIIGPRRRDIEVKSKDNKLGYKYSWCNISLPFILSILEYSEKEIQHIILRRINGRRVGRIQVEDSKVNEKEILDELFKKVLNRLGQVIKIEWSCNIENKEIKFYKSLMRSYLFNINLAGFKIKLCKDIKEFFGIRNNKNSVKNRDILTKEPYRTYDKGLLDLYSVASCSSDPFTQYMYYYQILEHFFTKIPNNKLVNIIQDELANPEFIFTKREKILELIETVKNETNSNKKEKNALNTVLEELIEDINDIREKLNEDDIDYLKNEKASFLGSVNKQEVTIDMLKKPDGTLKRIANRIYFIRNALVHNKETTKNNYDPLIHSEDLEKEVPLIKAISEIIISKTGVNIQIEN